MPQLVLCMFSAALTFSPFRSSKIVASKPANKPGRRDVLNRAFGLTVLGLRPSHAHAGDEDYKDLATKVSSKLLTSADTAAESSDALATVDWGAPKVTGLSTEEMGRRIDAGLRRECWFVSGRSLPELFSSSFKFSDPQVSQHNRQSQLTQPC